MSIERTHTAPVYAGWPALSMHIGGTCRRLFAPPDRRLFRIGDPFEAIYLIGSGAFKISRFSAEGHEELCAFRFPGEFIGLDGIVSGRHQYEGMALEPSTAHVLHKDDMQRMAASPELFPSLLMALAHDSDCGHLHSQILGHREALGRLAYFLLDIGDRIAQETGPTHFRLPMSRADIACHLGLARETVSRAFAHLQADGMVDLARRSIRIIRPEELMRIAHHAPNRPMSSGPVGVRQLPSHARPHS